MLFHQRCRPLLSSLWFGGRGIIESYRWLPQLGIVPFRPLNSTGHGIPIAGTFLESRSYWHQGQFNSTKDDEVALNFINDTVQFESGRYLIQWPWKNTYPEFLDNYGLALGLLKSLLKRNQTDEQLRDAYNQTIADQAKKGIIEVAPETP